MIEILNQYKKSKQEFLKKHADLKSEVIKSFSCTHCYKVIKTIDSKFFISRDVKFARLNYPFIEFNDNQECLFRVIDFNKAECYIERTSKIKIDQIEHYSNFKWSISDDENFESLVKLYPIINNGFFNKKIFLGL